MNASNPVCMCQTRARKHAHTQGVKTKRGELNASAVSLSLSLSLSPSLSLRSGRALIADLFQRHAGKLRYRSAGGHARDISAIKWNTHTHTRAFTSSDLHLSSLHPLISLWQQIVL